ncbi:MAG: methyltransferase domain-containing protein [Elainella sp.]
MTIDGATVKERENFLTLLQCVKCGGHQLELGSSRLNCQNCGASYSMLQGIPVFLDDPSVVKILPLEHTSNSVPKPVFEWLKQLNGYGLNIGAGASQVKLPNLIEMEYAIFKNTDVVADAHHLPFRDEVFEAVVAFNVFEHLSNPKQAAQEIFRVLKPGGKVIIHTAFLQPLHEAPYHFFNATKYGVMQWFSDFKVQVCQVSENFNPAFTLAWLSSELLQLTGQVHGTDVSQALAKTTLADWAKLWEDPNSRQGLLWEACRQLPQEIQEKISAGFELEAVKSPHLDHESTTNGNGHSTPLVCKPSPVQSVLLEKLISPTSPTPGQAHGQNANQQVPHATASPPAVSTSINKVRLFVTTLGNHFMIEIAYIYAEGFTKSGIPAEIAIDKIPDINPNDDLMQIVIAPHEFFNLFLVPRLNQGEIKDIVKSVYMLSAEQPYSPWFDMACERSRESKGVLDITAQTTQAYIARGVPAVHLPLGYASVFEAGVADQKNSERPVDLLFLGSHSPKREAFVSRYASFFNQYNSQITITRLEKPKFAKTPGFYANEKRNQLLRSSKIIINVHAVDNTYFEWLRAMMAIANGCLFVTETSDYIEPLINYQHIVMTSLEDIHAQCEYYLTHEDERLKIVNRAYDFVTRYFNSQQICTRFLGRLQAFSHLLSKEALL